VSYATVRLYMGYRYKRRFVTFSSYVPHGVLHLKESQDSGVAQMGAQSSVTLELMYSTPLSAVAVARVALTHIAPHTVLNMYVNAAYCLLHKQLLSAL
jgi:hypothetical protein